MISIRNIDSGKFYEAIQQYRSDGDVDVFVAEISKDYESSSKEKKSSYKMDLANELHRCAECGMIMHTDIPRIVGIFSAQNDGEFDPSMPIQGE